MKRMQHFKRFLSLALVVAMLAAYAVPVGAAQPSVLVEKVDNDTVSASLLHQREDIETNTVTYEDEDMVRVSIVLTGDSAVEAGFSTKNFGQNAAAAAYRSDLAKTQQKVTAKIESAIQGSLDVVWNLTLAANLISANVAYGDIKAIEQVPGVEKVVLETRYEPQEATTDATTHPNMAVSSQMVGSNIAWQAGLTGAGRRVAIIDTGLDLDHQSVDPDALAEAYRLNAEEKGVPYEEYIASLNLLDEEEIASVLPQLNVSKRFEGATAEMIYQNLKAPFGYNYIDNSFYLTHDEDQASEHGSHVAGISAANRLIDRNGSFVNAAETVGVVGNAPDAQILVMKVFGKGGGAYDSDYMAAIEDAIVMGCDSANLSLGSASAGMVTNETYQEILDGLANTDTVVSISAGNSGYWAEKADHIGLPYVDAPNYHTGGSPGSYTNSLAVASVDNDGGVGHVIRVADHTYMFSENHGNNNEYTNAPIASLDTTEDGSGVTLEYVFVEGIGNLTDYEGIDLTGKVALCARGGITFSEKCNNAASLGAAAVIIYDNQPGLINMNLADYTYTQPCVAITQADGMSILADSVKAEDGNYYTGSMVISNKMAMVHKNSDFLTMSAFSSWGAPGNLSMKPEITAPGGQIYSINGATPETDQYELMSGTSMAAPQITGITALVMQYIDQNNLSQDGMTDRALAQSLMMSTATPLIEGESGSYFPILQQGAGLVNTAAATTADSYVTVADNADGKVKFELGDDPARNGVYTMTFTLHNLTDSAKAYALSADLFTQNLVAYYPNADAAAEDDQSNLAMFFDKTTMAMDNSLTTWTVNGVAASGNPSHDVNGDGVTNNLDAQMILDYTTGLVADISAAADIDADGAVTSYDAHLLLLELADNNYAVVPASGSAEVTVTLTLTESDKEVLNGYCTAGAYIEAYIFADACANEEGAVGTSHSIPVLGYSGNWADASMFDIGSYVEYSTGEEVRTPYLLNPNANAFGVTYANDPTSVYYFGGNPLLPDLKYMPERDAINSNDILSDVTFTPIRNAGASRILVVNTDTDEVLVEQELGPVSGAFYNDQAGAWAGSSASLNLNFAPDGIPEGEHVAAAIQLASEYYVHEDGSVDWDALTDGSTFSISAVIDNTAPVLGEVKLSEAGDKLLVDASDNQYISAVVLTNAAGTKILGACPAYEDIAAGETASYEIDLTGVNGRSFLLQAVDYAMNMTTYRIDFQIGEPQPMPKMIAFNYDLNCWIVPEMDTYFGMYDEPYSTTNTEIISGTIVDHVVLASDLSGMLYAMPEYDLSYEIPVAKLGLAMLDMAYNAADDTVYGLGEDSVLYSIDRYTGAIEAVCETPFETNTLAIDKEGNFYSNLFATGNVYKYTLDTLDEPVLLTTFEAPDADSTASAYLQSMEADPNTGNICWTGYFEGGIFGYSYLIVIDPDTGAYEVSVDQIYELGALLIPENGEGGEWGEPVDQATNVTLSSDTASVLKGGSIQLSAMVQPWNASDRTVSWSSENESVATVNSLGIVTGVGIGTTTITASSNLNPAVTASCEVTVEALDVTFNGMLQGSDGKPVFFDWNMAEEDTWTAGAALDTPLISGTYDFVDDVYYVLDDTDNHAVHALGADGKRIDTQPNGAGVPLWDMAYTTAFSEPDAPKVASIYGYFLLSPMDPMHLSTMAFDLGDMVNFVTTIASFGEEIILPLDATEEVVSEHIAMLDDMGVVYHFWMYETPDGMSADYESYPTNMDYKFELYENELSFTNMVVGNDGNLYVSAFNGETNELYRLTFDAANEMYNAECVGNFGQDIWPAILTTVTANAEQPAAVTVPTNAKHMDAVSVTAEDLAAFEMPVNKRTAVAGGLNAVAEPAAAPAPVESLGTVTVEVKASDVATNGLYTFAMDSDLLALNRVNSDMDLISYREADGVITLAFANELEVPADTVVAELVLNAKHYHIDTVLDATLVEHNDQTPNEELDGIEIHYDNCPSARFTDVDTEKWYHESVDYVVYNNLMNGIGENTFGVYHRLNRAQLVTILYRIAGEPAAVAAANVFPDVASHSYFADAVAWAVANGIIKGEATGTFDPYRDVTRAEMVTMLYRFAEYEGCDVSARADLSVYDDTVPAFASDAMAWAVASGVVKGTSATTLSAAAPANRAQAASVIADYMVKVAK